MDLPLHIDYKALFLESIKKFPNNPKWLNGCFSGIKVLSNTGVGNAGEDFIIIYAKKLGFDAKNSTNRTSWDVEINHIKYELKTATEDVHGKFQFNHFRTHRQYEAAICLGVSPNDLYFDVLTKKELLEKPLVSMEKGANASFKWTRSKNELYHISKFKELISEFTREFIEDKQREEENKARRKKLG